jgi:hypothetical protein
MLYSGYTTFGSLYIFSASLTRCAEYVCYDVCCNDNFSIDDFNHLTVKQRKLETVRDAILKRIS